MAWQDDINEKVEKMQNTKDFSEDFSQEEIQKSKVVCALSYLGILFFLPLVVYPDSRYGRFHANQGLVAFIFYCIVNVVRSLLSLMINLIFWNNYVGGIVAGLVSLLNGLISLVLSLLILVCILFGVINTLNGKAKELPVIGKIRLFK